MEQRSTSQMEHPQKGQCTRPPSDDSIHTFTSFLPPLFLPCLSHPHRLVTVTGGKESITNAFGAITLKIEQVRGFD